MKKIIVVLIVCFAGLQLSAQTKQEKISELMTVMYPTEVTNKIFENMFQFISQQSKKELNQNQQEELARYEVTEFQNLINKATKEYYPKMYDKYFSEQEIDGLIKFFRSSTGQKYLNATPDIQKDLLKSMNQDYIDLKNKIENKRKEMKERS